MLVLSGISFCGFADFICASVKNYNTSFSFLQVFLQIFLSKKIHLLYKETEANASVSKLSYFPILSHSAVGKFLKILMFFSSSSL